MNHIRCDGCAQFIENDQQFYLKLTTYITRRYEGKPTRPQVPEALDFCDLDCLARFLVHNKDCIAGEGYAHAIEPMRSYEQI